MKKSLLTIYFIATALNCFSQIPNYLPSNGLVAWFPFNGNANDESGVGNNGIVNGSTLTTDRLGNPDASYLFDGIDDHIYVGILNGILPTSSHSVAFWVKKEADGCNHEMVIATSENLPNDNFNLHYGFKDCAKGCETVMCMGMDFYANSLVTSVALDVEWVHWVLVYDANSLERKIYQGCTEIGQGFATAAYEGDLDVLIGSAKFAGQPMSAFFNGKIDDIAIWNRVLTPQEAATVCNSGMTVGLNSLVDSAFEIYPNPSNGFVSITNQDLKNISLNVYDALGKLVYSTSINDGNGKKVLDLSWLGNGVYSIVCQSQNYLSNKKLIIQ